MPAGVVFEEVVVFAEQAEVAGGGGAEGPVDGVVEFAFLGWGVAAGGAAGAVAQDDVVDEVLGGFVAGASVVEDDAGGVVGGDPAPESGGG